MILVFLPPTKFFAIRLKLAVVGFWLIGMLLMCFLKKIDVLVLVCSVYWYVNTVHRNLESENSQDYAQKPQRNCTFMIMNSASEIYYFYSTVCLIKVTVQADCKEQKAGTMHLQGPKV
jgi:hypothetical protein